MANKYTAASYVTDTHAKCSKCKEIKLHEEFHKCAAHIYRKGLAYYCKPCATSNARKNHDARIAAGDISYKRGKRNQSIKLKFGISLEEYESKLEAQNSKCAICFIALPPSGYFTHLDHDHSSGKIRDFLCTNCNRGLGHFQDNREFLLNAAAYLAAHTENGTQKEGCGL